LDELVGDGQHTQIQDVITPEHYAFMLESGYHMLQAIQVPTDAHVLFERCKVLSGGRGPTITHRQRGNIEDIEFPDIQVVAEHHAARWWGWGEPISVTAWRRTEDGSVGTLRSLRFRRITGCAKNSIRIAGTEGNPVHDVLLDEIDMTVDHSTTFPGGFFDNRPVGPAMAGLEPHRTPSVFPAER
jgi:hypothetical protein